MLNYHPSLMQRDCQSQFGIGSVGAVWTRFAMAAQPIPAGFRVPQDPRFVLRPRQKAQVYFACFMIGQKEYDCLGIKTRKWSSCPMIHE